MNEFYDYFHILLLLSPLLFYILAIAFRLLDNSGFLLLKKDILIDSDYVSLKMLHKQLENSSSDEIFQKKIKRVMLYRKIHRICLGLMALCIPLSIYTWFYLF